MAEAVQKSRRQRFKKLRFPPRSTGKIDYKEYHEQSVLVLGFVGAMMFAGLVLILQSPSYSEQIRIHEKALAEALGPYWAEHLNGIMQTFLASIIGISAVGAFASMRALSHEFKDPRGDKWMYEFVNAIVDIVLLGFGIVVGLFLLPFNPEGGTIAELVFLAFFALFALIFVRFRRGSKPKNQPLPASGKSKAPSPYLQ